jgi:radical SAM superfamily enzyme with C-terminal helix-hairpin-helix motif
MTRTLIRYDTKPERAEENERLIEDVFRELHAKAPSGVRYMALRLGTGTFVHFVEVNAADGSNPLPELDAFRSFQSGIRDRQVGPAQSSDAAILGHYRMLGEE